MKQKVASQAGQEKRLFFTGVMLLGISNILVKIIGLLFKIPMSYYLGDEGMGYFNSAYQIYTWLYLFSTAGLPVALSLLIAESRTRGDLARVRRVEKVATTTFLLLGLLCAALMLFCARPLAALIGASPAYFGIAAMAPAMFFICLSSGLRGYFQGFQQMAPSAVSQVLEALGKLLIGVALADYAVRRGYSLPLCAAFAVLGLSVGEAAGTAYLFLSRWRYARQGRLLISPACGPAIGEGDGILRRLLRIALPITLSSMVMGITGMIDLVMVQRRLQSIGFLPGEATAFYGNYTTLVVPMFNLPPALIYPIATAALPMLSSALAKGDCPGAEKRMAAIMRITALIAMPCALGLAVFSQPILRLFFRADMADAAAPLLSLLAIGSLFLSMLTVSQAILQAGGHAAAPILSMSVGGAVKLVAGYVLIGLPAVGTMGVPLGTVLCYLSAMLCNLCLMLRHLSFAPSLLQTFFRPFAAALASILLALGFYTALGGDAGGRLLILPTIAVAAVAYVAAAFLTRTIRTEELAMLPGAQKLLQFFSHRRAEQFHS